MRVASRDGVAVRRPEGYAERQDRDDETGEDDANPAMWKRRQSVAGNGDGNGDRDGDGDGDEVGNEDGEGEDGDSERSWRPPEV